MLTATILAVHLTSRCFDTTCIILYPIELPFISKLTGDGKRHNHDFIVSKAGFDRNYDRSERIDVHPVDIKLPQSDYLKNEK